MCEEVITYKGARLSTLRHDYYVLIAQPQLLIVSPFLFGSSAFPPLTSQQLKRRAHKIYPSSVLLGQITGQPAASSIILRAVA